MTQSRHITQDELVRINKTGLTYKFISQKIGCTQHEFSSAKNGKRKLKQIDKLLKFLEEYENHNEWIAKF